VNRINERLPEPMDPFDRWALDQGHARHEDAPGHRQLIGLGIVGGMFVMAMAWLVLHG